MIAVEMTPGTLGEDTGHRGSSAAQPVRDGRGGARGRVRPGRRPVHAADGQDRRRRPAHGSDGGVAAASTESCSRNKGE